MLVPIEMLGSVLSEDLFFGIMLLYKKTRPRADKGLTIRIVEYDLSLAHNERTLSTFFFFKKKGFLSFAQGVERDNTVT